MGSSGCTAAADAAFFFFFVLPDAFLFPFFGLPIAESCSLWEANQPCLSILPDLCPFLADDSYDQLLGGPGG